VLTHSSDFVKYVLDGTPVRLENCSASPYSDLWFPVSDGQIGDGLCLDDLGDGSANGTKLVPEDCYGR
jgi:hypothetical protein